MKFSATSMRRFQDHAPPGNPLRLAADHPAILDARSMFPGRVVWAGFSERVLKSGQHSRKIGKRVTKGHWGGFPIYTLTLEERATCPASCKEWLTCYGNNLHWSERLLPGDELERRLDDELGKLECLHPRGFAVRLHILGDFYSAAYVRKWLGWLDKYTALHVFGYSAHPIGTEIGDLVHTAARDTWNRFAVRQSGHAGARGAVTVAVTEAPPPGSIVCPAQTDRHADRFCGSCTLCWASQKPVAFLRH